LRRFTPQVLHRIIRLFARYDRQLRWLLRRLTPGQYLGLHLTIGLLAAAGCLWFFSDLAEDLVERDSIVVVDQAVAVILRYLATPTLTTFFFAITMMGSVELFALLGLIVTVTYGWQRRWLHVGTWLSALGGAALLNQLLKVLFARPRPTLSDPLLLESGYSFPSGHAMGSLILYGVLAYFAVIALSNRGARAVVILAATLLVLLIGFSRMYLGVHYVSDVVAGYAAGGVWLSALITGMETIRRRKLKTSTKQDS
jgi:membrane-associated phospholipid phosphatase